MSNDEKLWEKACKIVGLLDDRFTTEKYPHPTECMAMLEWMAAEIEVSVYDDDTGEIVQVPERRGLPELWFGEDHLWHCRPWGYCDTAKHPQLPLALASAVVAMIKENHG